MNSLLSALTKFSDILDRTAGQMCVVLGAMMTIIVLFGVFFRYVLLSPLVWSEELSTFLMIWLAMLGGSMGIRRGRHVGISYALEKIPFLQKHRKAMSVFVNLLILIFLSVMLKEGFSLAFFAKRQVSPAMGISMFWPYFGLLVGGMTIALQVLYQIFEALEGEVTIIQDECSIRSE